MRRINRILPAWILALSMILCSTVVSFSAYAASTDGLEERSIEEDISEGFLNPGKESVAFRRLRAHVEKVTSRAIRIRWKVPGYASVTNYLVYLQNVDDEEECYRRVISGDATRATFSGLSKRSTYEITVAACQATSYGYRVVQYSPVIYGTTKGGYYGNAEFVDVTKIYKTSYSDKKAAKARKFKVSAGTNFKITASETNEHLSVRPMVQPVRFESSDRTVLAVGAKGRCVAKKAGTAIVYCYAQSGLFCYIRFTVV